ncbi:TetR/AcrR family transcriptional regulator C-terminal domain-containing protein [Aeromicrobium ginsengisoli]|uniref:TetR family transcriptional regulator n=1 Tax=Aeromicrobium ginsengisoli TaxID=363867 RepID=A0A5M4F981_9ACTN|nr:TetR/AcrR family transcriptional regulator C-terminal domain-containing protein [Aeromicrobium ginsengisoli]KAA1394253.1 TetR family transcriptional regulator [Aeromicrobium ginsengisoli]
MPRPSSPLISRSATVRAALSIIDDEGLDALSLPRLAREMNVRAPSLYHHFADKNEILAAVSQEIVRKTVFPRKSPTGDWAEWFTQLAQNFRTAVLRHRNAAPILLQFMPREMMVEMYESAAAYLDECGVPADLHVQILDGLEKLAVGATIAEAMRPPSRSRVGFEHVNAEDHPTLSRAVDANRLNPKQIFEHTVRCYLLGMEHFGNIEASRTIA